MLNQIPLKLILVGNRQQVITLSNVDQDAEGHMAYEASV